ncbi:hypothetical protein pdam_00023491 [Pocillopora damicornis]|uniref:Transposase Tc1-like domain-containing protein n=1 Tax=Pocillopora damicornis TaxID=46731 RepID=A0A3M6V694_POCDA|nr:hypothetical protein pdam_00023491 [Pocillopora damicornis]
MRRDEKPTSNKIKKKLERHGICVSASTVRRARKQQGWTLQWTAYCQLICDANKVKRLEFAHRVLESDDTFNNVIFSDECSISLQAYRRTCFRMDGHRGICSKEVEDVSKVRMRSILASCLAKEHSSLPKTVLIN